MQHTVSFDSSLKYEPPPHPGEDHSTKRAKLDAADDMDSSDLLASTPSETRPPGPSTQEFVPETPVPSLLTATPPEQDVPMSEGNVDPGPKIPSFKDKLLNSDSTTLEEEEDDLVIQQGDVSIGLNGNVPTVDFASHVLETLNHKMGLAVVVKLMGRRIGYRQLRMKLQSMWKPVGQCKLIDLEDDCFLVRFKSDLDYQNALLNGPWVIFGHYLTVQPWSPSFKTQEHTINQVMGWIRLPKLPARYYHKSIIRSIGSVFGEVIKVDYNTESGDRGKFARLAVTIDLTKPLISKIQVDGEILFVEYEGLPIICFGCGRYGHREEACPEKMDSTSATPPAEQGRDIPLPKPAAQERDSVNYGEWMLVQRRPRRASDNVVRKNAPHDGKIVASTSRYEALNNLIAHDEESQEAFVQENENPPLRTEGTHHKKKGKEAKGTPKKASDILTKNQDFVAQPATTLLDKEHNTVVLVSDRRLPQKSSEVRPNHSGPSRQSSLGQDPLSSSKGLRLATGVSLHNMGAKANPDDTGPSVRLMKEVAKELQPNLGYSENAMLNQEFLAQKRIKSSRNWVISPLIELKLVVFQGEYGSFGLPVYQLKFWPILINLGLQSPSGPSPRPFRFLAPWISHPEFPSLVNRIWNSESDLLTCIDKFTASAQRWNSEIFGSIGKRKRRLLNRIRGIQIRLEDPGFASSDFLTDLDISLKEELEDVCFQEELLWIQKSSSDWLCLGDRNTRYYQLKALMRRKRNSIKQLKNPDGVWILEEGALAAHSEQFFKELYTLEDSSFSTLSTKGMFPRLSEAQLLALERGRALVSNPITTSRGPSYTFEQSRPVQVVRCEALTCNTFNINVEANRWLLYATDEQSKMVQMVRWETPPCGTYKINVDRSFIVQSRKAELLAIKKGLELAWNVGCCNVIYEIDSTCSLELVKWASTNVHMFREVVGEIRKICERKWERVELVHVLRERNQCTDYLAKFGSRHPYHCLWMFPLYTLTKQLEDDARGTFYFRRKS
ncbi:hypothetical protein K1719_020809 [Acacia pycnantha]|nr:hypothetical protein K1719_020809 [Acacia pycnantha]